MNRGVGLFRAARPKFVFAPHRRFASLGTPYFQNLLPSPLYIRSTNAIRASVQGFLQPVTAPHLRFFTTDDQQDNSNPENLPGESKPLALVIEDEIHELRELASQNQELNHVEEYLKEKNWKIVRAPESMIELSSNQGEMSVRVVFQARPVEEENPYAGDEEQDPEAMAQAAAEGRDAQEGEMQTEESEDYPQGPPRKQYEHPFTIELSRPGRRMRVVLRCIATEEDFYVSEIMNAKNEKALPLLAETDLSEQLQEGIYEQLALVGVDNRIGQVILEQVNKNFHSQKMEVLEQMRSFFK
jgi:hypothetical protein